MMRGASGGIGSPTWTEKPGGRQPDSFAFNAENMAWAKEKIAQYPAGKQASAVIPLLWRAQEQNDNWVSKPVLEYIADMLGMSYIRVLEMNKGAINLETSTVYYDPETVPQKDKYYMPVQCQQCDNPPCVHVCPVEATWKEDDGIVVVDYNWCIGCRYCQAHTSHSGHRLGVDEEKFANILQYETSADFEPAEKAVIALGLAAGQVPNESSDAQFAALAEHFTERQIVQIVAVISLFGFLNRWNDSMATTLEEGAIASGESLLAHQGWGMEKHI